MAPAAGLRRRNGRWPPKRSSPDTRRVRPHGRDGGPPAEEPQLAYSMADDDDELLPVEMDEYGDEFSTTRSRPARAAQPRSLLISNAVVAFAVIGFASLAVAVAITVRPTAASRAGGGTPERRPGKVHAAVADPAAGAGATAPG